MIAQIEENLKLTAARCMRRVVRPSTSTWNGTCHQWFWGLAGASRTLPTTWRYRCSVSFVGSHAVSGSSGSDSVLTSDGCGSGTFQARPGGCRVRPYTLAQVDAQPVICAFEASAPARRAVEAAAWLAGALGAPLEVIHVFDAGAQAALPREGALRDPVLRREARLRIDDRERARRRRMLQSVIEPLRTNDANALVLDGLVVPTLHDAAAERRAVLLVSGTAARAGLQHVLEGSVAGTLAANAPCPVVTVPPEAALAEPGPVLVGDDGSEHARRAVHHAATLADRFGRDLVRMEAEGDDPVNVLAAAGREHRSCLIATGTRGRGPIRAEVFGSVSSGLVQTADRPVMLVPASAGDAPARGG